MFHQGLSVYSDESTALVPSVKNIMASLKLDWTKSLASPTCCQLTCISVLTGSRVHRKDDHKPNLWARRLYHPEPRTHPEETPDTKPGGSRRACSGYRWLQCRGEGEDPFLLLYWMSAHCLPFRGLECLISQESFYNPKGFKWNKILVSPQNMIWMCLWGLTTDLEGFGCWSIFHPECFAGCVMFFK